MKNELLRTIKINFMLIFASMVYTLFKSKFVWSPLDFRVHNGHVNTKNVLFRKQMMHFNAYITGSYFQIYFIPIINCDIKQISRNSHRKSIKKFLKIVKVDLKSLQKPGKINVKYFILSLNWFAQTDYLVYLFCSN